MAKRNSLWANIDWITILTFLLLVFMGWINIYAAVYNEEFQSIFDTSQRYGKQLIWIGAALLIAFVILLIDTNFYVFFSYVLYGFFIILLILVLIFGREINGAKSWFTIGSFGFQPSEFMKFATALVLARYMNVHGFKIHKLKSLAIISAIIFTPVFFILLQNDTGSALVYFSFIFVLYREGLTGVVLFFGFLVAILFILALILSNLTLGLILLGVALFSYLILSTKQNQITRIIGIFIVIISLFFASNYFLREKFEMSYVIIAGSIVSSLLALIYSIRKRIKNYIIISSVFLGAILFTLSVDYGFENLLEPHHQVRINELLGIESNPQGAGYHVNQSKIAIGSGGFWGKGYLNGTQTKFDFVPEQSTDFIFCTVGEEWGFAGTSVVIVLFLFLLIRLVFLAERQRSGFSRIYGYSVAVILFFHFMVNVGMTIGLMPVIGIPLPFFSYGGSSLWSFTILLFIFIRLDSSRLEKF